MREARISQKDDVLAIFKIQKDTFHIERWKINCRSSHFMNYKLGYNLFFIYFAYYTLVYFSISRYNKLK